MFGSVKLAMLKPGMVLKYNGTRVKITDCNGVRASFQEVNGDLAWGNIPLHERPSPGQRVGDKTNLELFTLL